MIYKEKEKSKKFFKQIFASHVVSFLGVPKTFIYKSETVLKHKKTGRKEIHLPPEDVRILLTNNGFTYPKKIISFQVIKGGVGKTSLSFCLSVRASSYGARVLIIDLDQQANLTRSFSASSKENKIILDLLRGKVSAEESIIKINDFLHLIPSNLNNSVLDIEINRLGLDISSCLKKALEPIIDNYDLVVLDCPPAINSINTAASCFSDLIIIPITADQYSLDGMSMTISEITRIRSIFNKNFDYKIILNKVDKREKISISKLVSSLEQDNIFEKIFVSEIGVSAAIKNAIFDDCSIFEVKKYIPTAANDIDYFVYEVLEAPSARVEK